MNFKYEQIADSLDDAAFAFCSSKVYPSLYFKVIRLEDMRRIDLAEKLYEMDDVLEEDFKRHKGSLDYYRYLLLQYLKSYARCVKGSRNGQYYDRAVEMATDTSPDYEEAIVHLKDTLMIFLSIARQHTNPKGWKEIVTEDVEFDLFISDEDTLDLIHCQKELVPPGLMERKVLPFDPIIQLRKRYFYCISTLLLSAALQDRGAFAEENA